MKKISLMIVAAGLLATSAITSCKKEAPQSTNTTNSVDRNLKIEGNYRAYEWKDQPDGKKLLSCTKPGKGCDIGKKVTTTSESTFELSMVRIDILYNSPNSDFRNYFLNNSFSNEFPQIYEQPIYQGIQNGSLDIHYNFPFLKIVNSNGEIVFVYSFEDVVSTISSMAANRLATLSTDGKSIWSCTAPGTTCEVSLKVSPFATLDQAWIMANLGIITKNNPILNQPYTVSFGTNNTILIKAVNGADILGIML